jgi:hypothetical protein
VTTDECAARLKAGASSSESDDQCWRGLDRLVCVDSTWQQATGIMKVSAHQLGAGLHLESFPRGSKMSKYENKRGGGKSNFQCA